MGNKKLQEVAAKITEMLEENEKKKEEMAGKISTFKQMHKESVEAISEALGKADVEGYHKAQDAARQAKDATEMYQGRMNRLEETPLLSEGEYSDMVQEIMNELASVVSKDKEKILSLIDKMRAIGDQESEIIEEGNRLLHILQHRCYKDDACFVTAKGKKVYSETLEKSYKDYSVMMFVGKIKEDDFYKENGGE